MKTVVNLFKRSKILVRQPDRAEREIFVLQDAKNQAMLSVYSMFRDIDLRAGDEIILDVRLQVERNETEHNSTERN